MEHQGQAMLLAVVVGYFLPFIVANMRGHRQTLAIFMLNLLAGWTAIGWIVAIVWACTDNVRSRPTFWESFDRRGPTESLITASDPASQQKAIAAANQYRTREKLLAASVGIMTVLLWTAVLLMVPR